MSGLAGDVGAGYAPQIADIRRSQPFPEGWKTSSTIEDWVNGTGKVAAGI
jgi:hypothetical protein